MVERANSGEYDLLELPVPIPLRYQPRGRKPHKLHRLQLQPHLVADELREKHHLDELLHAIVEVGLGKGPLEKRANTWLRKAAKHRLNPR